MMDNMQLLDIVQQIVLFFGGCALGIYVTRTGKPGWQVFILQLLVYWILILLYFAAKAIVEQHMQ